MQILKRVKLFFAPGLEIGFVDRERALKQVFELGERGTGFPVVVFGPEGCGKTSWLLQTVEILKGLGYGVIYFNPMRKQFDADVGVDDLKKRALEIVRQVSSEYTLAKFIWSVIDFAKEALKHGRKKLAIIVDDAFRLIGAREASLIVKGMLELIEHPDTSYEKIVAIAATSEGISRWVIGRHLWAEIFPMWSMSRKGFEELYESVPGYKPPFEEIWRLSGGNPRIFSRLYQASWRIDTVIKRFIKVKKFTREFIEVWRKYLEKAVEDPDTLSDVNVPEKLRKALIRRNLIVYDMYDRDPELWVDEPPPERDQELGIGRYVAWQTPLHREAVKKSLEIYKT